MANPLPVFLLAGQFTQNQLKLDMQWIVKQSLSVFRD